MRYDVNRKGSEIMDDREFLVLNEELSIRYPGASASDIWEITVMVARCIDRRRRRTERACKRHAPRGSIARTRTSRRALYGMAEGCCAMCGEFVPFEKMTVGHIIPRSWGGTWAWGNLQMECEPCNRRKGARVIPRREGGVPQPPWPGPGRPAGGPYQLVHPPPRPLLAVPAAR